MSYTRFSSLTREDIDEAVLCVYVARQEGSVMAIVSVLDRSIFDLKQPVGVSMKLFYMSGKFFNWYVL